MLQEHVLAEEEQMTAARTKQHEEDKHTGIRTDEKKKRSKQGKKAGKSVLKASIVTNLSVSAAKPGRGPCGTICYLLPTLVDIGIKCQYCRCREILYH